VYVHKLEVKNLYAYEHGSLDITYGGVPTVLKWCYISQTAISSVIWWVTTDWPYITGTIIQKQEKLCDSIPKLVWV
jgi:hypothetical protein